MKLIDLLVQELPKRGGWPSLVRTIHQDYDGEVWGWINEDESQLLFTLEQVAMNARLYKKEKTYENIVTREQYEAALAASKRCIHEWIPNEGRTSSGVLCRNCGDYNGPGEAEKSDADGWIEWHGGECPIDCAAFVDYKMRGGEVSREDAHLLRWDHKQLGGDIIAYRLHRPQDANSRENALANSSYLPSPGETFEYGSHRTVCKCLAVGEYYVFASKGEYNPEDEDSRYEEFMIARDTEFYPFDNKRDETIKALSEVITRSSAIAVYDKVQRNEVPGLVLTDD